MNNPQQEELLKQLRANLFSGNDFSDAIIKQYTGRYKGIDIPKTIDMAKNQMKPASLAEVSFDKIVKLHESRKRIVSLIDNHSEYLLNELSGNKNEKPFEFLSASFEKSNQNRDQIAGYIKYLEDRASKQENKDQKDRLYETVREFAQWCKDFLLNEKYASTYPVLTKHYGEIVSKISGSVSKIGINIIAYRDLAEECYALLCKNTNDACGFQRILALINLRCAGLGVPVPSVKSSLVCPNCGDKEQAGNICTKCYAYIKCPGCDAVIVKDAKICGGCGAEIANFKTWLESIENAEKKLSTGEYEAAEDCIKDVKTKWGKYERLLAVTNKIADIQKKVDECEKKVDENIAKTCYFTAQKIIDSIKREKIVLPKRLAIKETVIREEIAKAEKLASAGDANPDPLQKSDCYAQAISLVADFEVVINKLKNLNIHAAGLTTLAKGLTVQVNWNKLNCKYLSVKYIVYREENAKGKTEITRTSSNSYNDTIEPGISYFYHVQVEYVIASKSGTISGVWESVKSQEEIIEPAEVSHIAKNSSDRQVSITFKAHPNACEVKIERTANGSTKKFPDNYNKGTFLDTDVVNDTVYSYRIYSLFRSLSKGIIVSKGVEVNIAPVVPPMPVEWITTDNITEHITEVSWKKPPKGTVAIYICEKPLNLPVGPVDETALRGKYISAGQAAKVQIPHDFHGVRYLYAVTMHNNSCVIGKPKIIKYLRKLQDVDFNKTERRVELTWKRDNEIKEVAVFTQVDDAPERIEIIPNTGKHTVIAPQGAKTFSIAAASCLKTEDNSKYYSEKEQKLFVLQATRLNFVEVSGGGFLSKSDFKITIQANTPIPCNLHVLIGEGRTPIDTSNYAPHLTISQKDFVCGDKPITYPLKYSRNDKSKPLIFRIIPSEKAYFNSIVIAPETRQIK